MGSSPAAPAIFSPVKNAPFHGLYCLYFTFKTSRNFDSKPRQSEADLS